MLPILYNDLSQRSRSNIYQLRLFGFKSQLLLVFRQRVFILDTMFAWGQRFWIAGMTFETKFKVKKFHTMLYLTLKAPPIICCRRQFQILPLFQKQQTRNDISWESSAGRRFSWNIVPYFFQKLGKISQNLSPAVIVFGGLRVNVSMNICDGPPSLAMTTF